MKHPSRGLAVLGCLVLTLSGCEHAPPDEAPGQRRAAIDANASVVISQVYGGGGNASAPYKNDFVELFNRSASAVALTGWSVQYASATGSGNFAGNAIVSLTGTLQPGQHYLIQLAGGTTGATLPTPDATGTVNMSGTAGKVILARTTTGLACNSLASCSASDLANVVDAVGYGTATAPMNEGAAPAPTLSNTTAALRAVGGCTDTNQNGSDFSAAAPAPRNSSSALTPCATGNVPPQVLSTAPTNGAANVALDANLTLTFSEDVSVTGTWFSISCSASGNVAATVSGGPQAYTLDPTVTLQAGETCNVTIAAAGVTDVDSTHPTADYVYSFTTSTPVSSTPIHAIQGASHISPLKGVSVTTRGIVTALGPDGYYLQDPVPDADPATSEALFVFTSSAPTVRVGDDVQVSGKVNEFRSGCISCTPSSSAYANLTATELNGLTLQAVLTSGNPLPAPIVIGAGGRVPPTSVIEDDASGDVEVVANTFDPDSDGLDFYESLEDMRVQVNDAVAVGPTATFSGGSLELPVLADNGNGASLRTARGGIIISASDFNPERIMLANDLVSALPSANTGDRLPGAVVGVMSYTFGNFKLLYTQALPALSSGGLGPEQTTLGTRRPLELDIAAFNVQNLDPTDPPAKFAQLASILVSNLKSPDLVSLEEIQDNDGAADSGTVDATTTLNQLVAAITTAGGPSYQYRLINPVNDQDGGEPGGNIRVALLYRTDRGLAFVDRSGASSLTPNAVVGSGASTALQYSPGRIDPTNSAFSSSRKPLAGEFTFGGQTLFVIANHFNSKGGDDPLFGRFQPPTLSSETQRSSQASVVKGFVSQLLGASPNAQVVVLGDLNDFEFSAPLMTLKSGGLSDLIERLPQSERYTYVYQGNSQALDHILVSSTLTQHVVGYDVVHVNSELVTQASDHDPGIARVSFDRTPPVVTGPSIAPVVTATGPSGATVTFSVTASDPEDGALPVTCSPASGSVFKIGITQVTCSATDAGGNVTQLQFNVTVQSGGPTPAPALPAWLGGVLACLLFGAGRRRLARADLG